MTPFHEPVAAERADRNHIARELRDTSMPASPMDSPTAVRWRILGWAVLAAVVAYILRFNMSVAAPAMMRDLGLTEQQLGVVLGAFAWGYGLLQAPGGAFGQRLGPHKAMTLLFVGWFVTTALMALVPHAIPAAAAVTLLVLLRWQMACRRRVLRLAARWPGRASRGWCWRSGGVSRFW